MASRTAILTAQTPASDTRMAGGPLQRSTGTEYRRQTLCVVKPTIEPEALPATNPRWLSPRETADLSHELYVSGNITYHEHLLLGSPAELHPDYDLTIGALTGRMAEPDKPRDVLAEWERRLSFETRYGSRNPVVADRVARIVGVLRSLAKAAEDQATNRTAAKTSPTAVVPLTVHASGGRQTRAVAASRR